MSSSTLPTTTTTTTTTTSSKRTLEEIIKAFIGGRPVTHEELVRVVSPVKDLGPMCEWTKQELAGLFLYHNCPYYYTYGDCKKDFFEVLKKSRKLRMTKGVSVRQKEAQGTIKLPPVERIKLALRAQIQIQNDEKQQDLEVPSAPEWPSHIPFTTPKSGVVNKSPLLPKNISKDIFFARNGNVKCCVCLHSVSEDTYAMSKCAHDYCTSCFSKLREPKCFVCQSSL